MERIELSTINETNNEANSNNFLEEARKVETISDPKNEEGVRNRLPHEPDATKQPDLLPTHVLGLGSERDIPDINFYQHKKTLAKGMMDLALFSANANQLRYVLECQDRHPYFYASLTLIIFSLICQVVVGITLLWNAMYNVKSEMDQANRANNCTVIGIFLVTVVNVFISAFGVANPPPVT